MNTDALVKQWHQCIRPTVKPTTHTFDVSLGKLYMMTYSVYEYTNNEMVYTILSSYIHNSGDSGRGRLRVSFSNLLE